MHLLDESVLRFLDIKHYITEKRQANDEPHMISPFHIHSLTGESHYSNHSADGSRFTMSLQNQKNLFVKTCDEIGKTSTKVMESLGLFPFVNKSGKQKFYSVFIIVSILVTFTQITITMVQSRTETLVEIADRGSIFGCGVLALVKIFLFVYRGSDYHDLVVSLSDDTWWQDDEFMAEEYEEIVKFYLNVFKKINIFLVTIALLVLNVFIASPLLIMGYHKFFDPDNYVRFLPFDVWNGFVDKEKRFWEVFLYETLMQAFIVLLFLAYDAFNLAVMTQIYIHLECLLKAIYPVVSDADKLALEKLSRSDADFKVISEKVYARLSILVMRYSKIVG